VLATTLVQSSSVTTSMIVALVAAPESPLPIANAIPMIMGANIGTTVTNTIVSLGHVSRPEEFRRAFSTATCHDFFNFIAVAALLPLELATGVLTRGSAWIASFVGTGGPGKLPNPIKSATKAVLRPVTAAVDAIVPSTGASSIVMIALGAATIFLALVLIVRTLRALAETKLKSLINKSLGRNAYVGILVGTVVTVMVQSSSITTSILVPLAAAGVLSLEHAFPITLGANIGTTLTAVIASAAAPPETAHLAVQIASVHFLFNVVGIALIYPFERLRNVPLRLARWLAGIASESRRLAVFYVIVLFYGAPAGLLALSRLL
jgi:sodium-dependent phosphate cotransporter